MIFGLWEILLLVLGVVLVLLWYANHVNSHFQRKGVVSTKNPLPFLGHMIRVFFGKEHILQTVYRAYHSHPDDKFFGFYAFNNPTVVIKDLDLIKKITVKDFDSFIDHKVFMDEDADPLFGKNLFFLKGQKWRVMRMAMTPAYTGSKMKNMLPFVLECAEQMVVYFRKEAEQLKNTSGGDYLQVEMKDVFTRFTNDVIASTAFGVEVNSLENKANQFYLMGRKATDFSGVQFLKFFGYSAFPKLMKLLGISLFPENVKTFFRNVVRDAMKARAEGCVRQDMIHLLNLLKKGSLGYDNDPNYVDESDFAVYKDNTKKEDTIKIDWTHDDLTAQAVAFLLAGFDTSSTLLCFTAYELATHPSIQRRLQAEIDQVISTTGGKLTYTDLQKMKYMDMVVSESLRMWPPDSQLERVCSKNYLFPPQNDMTSHRYEVKQNEDIWIPIYSIHHDSRYHPEPDTFNPERFSDDNKPFMQPFSFIPFGVGPRVCIGARFAVMEAKAMMFHLLASFDIIVTSKTTIPIKIAADTFTLHSADGFWLGMKLRESNA